MARQSLEILFCTLVKIDQRIEIKSSILVPSSTHYGIYR